MMGMERTMFKLLVVVLALNAILSALTMYGQISDLSHYRTVYGINWQFGFALLPLTVRFLFSVLALYWVPKIIEKFFPEVS
jgi:hypothetical protein